jgi:hypothetical protein
MNDQDNKINASPTKDFFITMLVKDIVLHQAILDLIDNCIDGAIALRGKDGNYEELEVRITLNENIFEITDNCGGFSYEVAKKYAFRFGRPVDAPLLDHSVGRFGVGMKRALFKIGKYFTIISTSDISKFQVSVDVDEWEADPETWSFNFDFINLTPQSSPLGTVIQVKKLHEGIAEQFRLDNFTKFLSIEVQKKNEEWMERGLIIYINDKPLSSNPAKMFFSEEIRPAFKRIEYNDVIIKMYAGLSKTGQPREAGWSVYCNNRLIVQADRSELTGWGEAGNPNFHNTYAMFRGSVYFDSDNSLLLPWNTTKSGIDQDSDLFRAVKLEMIKMMHPIIEYLKKLKASNNDEDADVEDDRENLERRIQETSVQRVSSIDESTLTDRFHAPPLNMIRKPDTQKIQYTKPISQIKKAKDVLNVSTLKEVGEKTFEYFYKAECED